ncbi:Hypothetical predicted protein [Mytilus galloprovincialis]|uniref:Mutator-like transposase domain-containing protein n=1 Tax=Mytilus galloprovincialis TaxID=29158 RepID=A0A8B6EPZ5_MYTGA|nr:Hypothetical predicted protein [Mytilus galloprovincialis]
MFPTFRQVVISLRDKSIDDALKEEKDKNSYSDNKLDIMTDARHACRKNSFHTDVTALGNLTHKVVGYSHVTKNQERSSQKHETFGTEKLYEDFERKRIKVKVHSHDRNASVSKYLSQNQPDVIDSYDTWHGAKEVRRNMAKITKGTRKNIGKTWHPELRDKSAGVKTHVYWAMKNCNGNAAQLVLLLDSIVDHYKQDHRNCHQTSRCKNNDYVPSRDIIRDPTAELLLRNSIKKPLYL